MAGASRDPKSLGREAENLAAAHLAGRGIKVVTRNYRALRGEVDIIGKDGDTWVFVEVKARSSRRYGGAAFAVPQAKQAQISKVASHYLLTNGLIGKAGCRFDVVLVDAATTPYGITHVPNAFRVEVG